jgi:hypothetical protein
MARQSRSNKKHPAFDPSEIEDLIFSPAVGKGVGSHLVTPAVPSDLSAVANLLQRPPVVPINTREPDPSTVVTYTTPSRDVEPSDLLPTVVTSASARQQITPPLSRSGKKNRLWITEHGDLVSEARVKRIRLAQDVINSAEECVYDTLWNAKLIQADEREACRLVQAGYDYLVKRTRLSRKTIQRIVAKLIEKDFIQVDTRADIYQRSSTIYRVFSYKAVLERNTRKGRLHVAKMGPGFAYARPVEDDESRPESAPHQSTVDMSDVTTMVAEDMTTVADMTTVTVVKNNPTTVVKMSPYLLDTDVLDNTSSSRPPEVYRALLMYGAVDDEVVSRFVRACREQAPDCTPDEIVHFIHEKGALVRARESRVYNPIGFLVTAVPKCFSGETLRTYRNQQTKEQTGHDAEEVVAMERWRREQESLLSNPNVSEQEKHLIRLCLGLNDPPRD